MQQRHKQQSTIYKTDGRDRLLPRLSLLTFDHFRIAAIIWAVLLLFGVLSYSVFMKRQGFPSVNVPITSVSGVYLVNDPARIDRQVTGPISKVALGMAGVKSVQATARGTFYNVVVQYDEGTDSASAAKELERRIRQQANLPAQVSLTVEAPRFGFTERGDDAVISLYRQDNLQGAASPTSTKELAAKADGLAAFVKSKHIEGVEKISAIQPFVNGVNPATGKRVDSQTTFDRYGERQSGNNQFHESVAVGITQRDDTDVIKLDKQLRTVVQEYNSAQPLDAAGGYRAVVSASYATDIKAQIGELQKSLLEGLAAVLVVGSLVIAIRASIITVISMLTVLATTVGVLYLAGYTLNTITLFALILCLGLVVDDTIIMVEAIDAQRRRLKRARDVVRVATRKVSRAMVAATLTAAMSFAPLLFAGGILGSFIRAIPVTVIASLLVSLFVSLVFIPLFARYLLLGKKQMGAQAESVKEPAAKLESRIADIIGGPMLWADGSPVKLFGVGAAAVLIGLSFVAAGGFLFQKVTFNIFPPSKDTNGLIVDLTFPPGTDIAKAQAVTDKADAVVAGMLGENFQAASYYANAGDRQAELQVDILPYSKRDIRSPELVTQLQQRFKGFQGALVKVGQKDVGPPASNFSVRILAADRTKAFRLADDIQSYLSRTELKRPSGKLARMQDVTVSDPASYSRNDGQAFISVTANFDADDTSTLVTLAQSAVKKEFDSRRLASYGLSADTIDYDLGQEQDNQDSFKALAFAFPVLLFAIYLLLALQFRSLMQPLLIFMAIPFSLFGITLGLYLSHNAFSFFAMLGFFALIGLSLKNTILLTDYANQLRREGSSAVEAAVGALHERFRPLIATSLTAVVSLIPLAIASPFWEGLAIVLIGGLLSSTFLVVTVFPYYYLGAEYLRLRVSRLAFLAWAGLTAGVSIGLLKLASAPFYIVAVVGLVVAVVLFAAKRSRRHRRFNTDYYRLRR